MTHKAEKLVVITENLILENALGAIEGAGAGGKPSRGVPSRARPQVVDASANARIEPILTSDAQADRVAEEVANRQLATCSGMTRFDDVEIARPQKFGGRG